MATWWTGVSAGNTFLSGSQVVVQDDHAHRQEGPDKRFPHGS